MALEGEAELEDPTFRIIVRLINLLQAGDFSLAHASGCYWVLEGEAELGDPT